MFLTSNMVPTGGASVQTNSFSNKFTLSSTQSGVGIIPDLSAIVASSGALTSGVYKNMITISGGSFSVPQLALRVTDATARVIKLRVTIDGLPPIEITSSSIAVSNVGVIACGTGGGAGAADVLLDGYPLCGKTSLSVDIQSNLTETDKLQLIYKRFSEA